MQRLLGVLAFLVAAAPCRAQSTATLSGVDLYRSDQVTLEQVQAKVGGLINAYIELQNGRKKVSVLKRAQQVKREIESRVAGMGQFAYVDLHYAEYFTSARHTSYLTFDLVDFKDAKTRLPFNVAPTATIPDPENLLAAWEQYSDLGSALRMRGELPLDRPTCSSFYCLWGPATPELEAFENKFIQGVPRNKKSLLAVLERDQDPDKRASALYLLSYLSDGDEVVKLAVGALHDPDEGVRAAALQIVADVSVYHTEVKLDPAKIIPTIDYPSASDRSKGLAALVGMCQNPLYRDAIIRDAGPYLPRLLRMSQPSNHDMTYTLLGLLSQESFERRDYESWEGWLYKNASGKPAEKK
jgi:hypothetical protein